MTENFDSKTVVLSGSNLVEASAGTGKTHSVAILALRLVVEKNISLDKILMVTFGKAAVRELEERVRKFIRLAYRYACGNDIKEASIKSVVDAEAQSAVRLKAAIAKLDETAIFTIHSFCQRSLTEFAFETNQIFGAETLEDLNAVVEDEVNDFWRTKIASIEIELLKKLRSKTYKVGLVGNEKYLSRAALMAVLMNVLSGKSFASAQCAITTNADFESEIKQLEAQIEIPTGIVQLIQDHSARGYSDAIRSKFIAACDAKSTFIEYVFLNKDKVYMQAIVGEELIKQCCLVQNAIGKLPMQIINGFYQQAINEVVPRIQEMMKARNQMSYDDLIVNLHQALHSGDSNALRTLLRKKYEAVFVDEFQDNDKFQYEIFNTLYADSAILFYIGDPKQVIYSWRKADLNSYFVAKKAVGKRYSMATNFRSSKNMVAAMNLFFTAIDDPFLNSDNIAMEYNTVQANEAAENSSVFEHESQLAALTIFTDFANESALTDAAVDKVKTLLIKGKIGTRKIEPSNIAVLVRSAYQATMVKEGLMRCGIPSIVIADTKVFESGEAQQLSYILQAVVQVSESNIRRALLCKHTAMDSQIIQKIDMDDQVHAFRKYADLCDQEGIYSCLMHFYTDFQVRENLLNPNVENGQRMLSNLFQLAEVLQKVQNEKQLDGSALLSFLNKALAGFNDEEGEAFVQRIESDNAAVTISTIHKSKGLEYDIVLAPYLELVGKINNAFSSFRSVEGDYVFTSNSSMDEEHSASCLQQLNQENRRLLYVAITRAKYQCFLFSKTVDKENALRPFVTALNMLPPVPNILEMLPYEACDAQYQRDNALVKYTYLEAPNFTLQDAQWRKLSYSFLCGEHAVSAKIFRKEELEPYDQFIFADLERGKNAGNLLHNIFEFVDFTNAAQWEKAVRISLERYLPMKAADFIAPMCDMLDHVLNVEIKCGDASFELAQVNNAHKCNELEFDMKVGQMHLKQLADLSSDTVHLQYIDATAYYGIMNGSMDLFFELKGKYYILDWKSNYLGDRVEDYAPELLVEAMNENNYHLQYHIYTLAAKRFLENRIPDFNYERDFGGVLYLFVRGIRKGSENGVFSTKLPLSTVQQLEAVFPSSKQLQ
jgi:exodeoxyribonuclease V beta subunit